MIQRNLFSTCIRSVRCFSSSVPCLLKVGDFLEQPRVFSNEDVLQYSKVSHDLNPLHFDSKAAQDAGFEDRLVHGMLVAGLFPRIIASCFPGAVYVSQTLQFKSPVYIGDAIIGKVQAINIREQKKRYLARFSTKCFKNGELLAADGEAIVILPSLAFEQQLSDE